MQKAIALKQAFKPDTLPDHLVLNLGGKGIQPEILNCIVDGLKMACPKKLKLRLNKANIGTDVSCLAEFISSKVELESLEFDLDEINLTPESAALLAIALTKNACRINHLSLSLADNATMVKNGGLNTLVYAALNSKVASLRINLSNCGPIDFTDGVIFTKNQTHWSN